MTHPAAENNTLPTANIICIKWGDAYGAVDVNRLYAMCARNLHRHQLAFYCFTDNGKGLNPAIHVHPLPEMKLENPADLRNSYGKEAGLCDDNLGGLNGQRVMFFDLDVVITGSLDEMVEYPKDDDFIIINDWNTKGDHVGQASCYSFRVGTLGDIKKTFEASPKEIVKKYGTAAQEFLSDEVAKRFGPLKFWPEIWCKSFKKHALPVWYKRAFTPATLPEGAKVLAFHGHPKIPEAIIGRWEDRVPLHKRLYKTIKPAPWLLDYWRE